jgi:signal transduction histidine kinase/CheY-like chemotaxis protein
MTSASRSFSDFSEIHSPSTHGSAGISQLQRFLRKYFSTDHYLAGNRKRGRKKKLIHLYSSLRPSSVSSRHWERNGFNEVKKPDLSSVLRLKGVSTNGLTANLDKASNPVILVNMSGRIEWSNKIFSRQNGFQPEEVIGKMWEKLRIKDDFRFVDEVLKRMQNHEPLVFEYQIFNQEDKNTYFTLDTVIPLCNDLGSPLLLLIIETNVSLIKRSKSEQTQSLANISTKLLESEKSLIELNSRIKHLEKELEEKCTYFSVLSHEIRGPMNGIIGLTKILLNSRLNREQRAFLNAISHSGDTMLMLLNDVLDLSKIEAGKMNLLKIPFAPKEHLQNIFLLYQSRAREKKINLTLNLCENLPGRMIGDPYKLNQILINLVSNAIKFTESGEVGLTVSCLEPESGSIRIHFQITDTGPGLAENQMHLLFQEFTQIHDPGISPEQGTGLGLVIVKKLVELQKGTINVSSRLFEGTTFNITLPFDLPSADGQDVLTGSKAFLNCSGGLEDVHILMAEDNEVNSLFGEKVLRNAGAQVTLADNGEEVIRKLSKGIFDIILMDLQMPLLDGYETSTYIRTHFGVFGKKVPILALSAATGDAVTKKCVEAGINGHLLKPFAPSLLVNQVKSLLVKKNESPKSPCNF